MWWTFFGVRNMWYTNLPYLDRRCNLLAGDWANLVAKLGTIYQVSFQVKCKSIKSQLVTWLIMKETNDNFRTILKSHSRSFRTLMSFKLWHIRFVFLFCQHNMKEKIKIIRFKFSWIAQFDAWKNSQQDKNFSFFLRLFSTKKLNYLNNLLSIL